MLRKIETIPAEEQKVPLTEEEKTIIENEYFNLDSSIDEPLLEYEDIKAEIVHKTKVNSIQLFILYLLKKHPNLVGKLNGIVIAPIIGIPETKYLVALTEADTLQAEHKYKLENNLKNAMKEENKLYFSTIIERHDGWANYKAKFEEIIEPLPLEGKLP